MRSSTGNYGICILKIKQIKIIPNTQVVQQPKHNRFVTTALIT